MLKSQPAMKTNQGCLLPDALGKRIRAVGEGIGKRAMATQQRIVGEQLPVVKLALEQPQAAAPDPGSPAHELSALGWNATRAKVNNRL